MQKRYTLFRSKLLSRKRNHADIQAQACNGTLQKEEMLDMRSVAYNGYHMDMSMNKLRVKLNSLQLGYFFLMIAL